jgi:predicted nucleotidyltransferase
MSLSETIAPKTGLPPTVDELRRLLGPFCEKHSIAKLEVFGSTADNTAKGGSDVDLMVTFQSGAEVDHLDLQLELEELLGRSVDLLTRESVKRMENWILRRSILECVRTIYAA